MFYLNLVGYKVIITYSVARIGSEFYLNLVGYKVTIQDDFDARIKVLSELSGI